MSEEKFNRADVLARLIEGRINVSSAARMMGVSERHVFRLLSAYKKEGASSLVHKQRGKRSNNRIRDDLRGKILLLIQKDYAGLNPTRIAAELHNQHDIKVSRETIRSWMIEEGICLSKAERHGLKRPDQFNAIQPENQEKEINYDERQKNSSFSRQILASAKLIIEKDGLGSPNSRKGILDLNSLTKYSGCSIGLIYYLYGSIDSLIQKLNEKTIHRIHDVLRKADKEASIHSADNPYDRLTSIAHAYLKFAKENKSLWRVLFDRQSGDNQKPVSASYEDAVNDVIGMVSEILSSFFFSSDKHENGAHEAAILIWSGVHGICVLSLGGSLERVSPMRDPNHLTKELVRRNLDCLPRK